MLIGVLGRDPEMRYTPQGKPVTSFSIGATRTWLDADGKRQTSTEWLNVITWHALAERCNAQLRKNARAYVEGYLQTRSWDDDHGAHHYRTEVVATRVVPIAALENEPEARSVGDEDEASSDAVQPIVVPEQTRDEDDEEGDDGHETPDDTARSEDNE